MLCAAAGVLVPAARYRIEVKRRCPWRRLLPFAALLQLVYAVSANAACAVPQIIEVAAGPFIAGSDRKEREAAYKLDEAAYGHTVTRDNGWYEGEGARRNVMLPAFAIMRDPVTNADYFCFVAETGHRAPDVSAAEWAGYGLVHPFQRTRRHAWSHGTPPKARERHPVVLVSFDDAQAFARWLSARTGALWRLPSELEWEKASRGTDGRMFPWGDEFDPAKLNSHDAGPFDTLPVGSFRAGVSPFGLSDAAGQVFEWTLTRSNNGRRIVKGGSWDDKGCGVCRPAARHARPQYLKHILIGFRLVRDSE